MNKEYFQIKNIWFEAGVCNNRLVELKITKEIYDIKEEISEKTIQIREYLTEYLSGKIYKYPGEIEISGTEKEIAVINKCMEIPSGEVLTYGELAEKAGIKNGARFAGNVMAKNKLILIVPCHRIVPAEYRKNNERTGNYGPGEKYKKRFLKLERGE